MRAFLGFVRGGLERGLLEEDDLFHDHGDLQGTPTPPNSDSDWLDRDC
jgi:hypothetical protein